MSKAKVPFFMVNPKSYIWGKESLALAKECDKICKESGVMIIYTCPYADIRLIAENTEYITVAAQNMDSLRPGRGMGAILPESLVEAGAKAVLLNHAENQKQVSELYKCIERAKELGLLVVVCADSTAESKAIAELGVDIILAEPTALIGTGQAADASYTVDCCREIKAVDPDVKVMIASGITTGQDVYNCVYNGADGSASTSGIVNAKDAEGNINTASRAARVKEMIDNLLQAMEDRAK
jgi:triosephosphate isomerase (TIM)